MGAEFKRDINIWSRKVLSIHSQVHGELRPYPQSFKMPNLYKNNKNVCPPDNQGRTQHRTWVHVQSIIFPNEIEVSRYVRVWGAPSPTAEGKRKGGHTWWMLVAGKGLGEDVRMAPPLAQASPPAKEDQGRRE